MTALFDLSTPEKYRKFLKLALNRADCIALSYTSDLSAFKESEWWEMFEKSFLKSEYDSEGNLTVYLKTDHSTVEWLKSKHDIFDFLDEDKDGQYLWDLCFIKNGAEFFATVSHERQQYIDEKFYSEYNQH